MLSSPHLSSPPPRVSPHSRFPILISTRQSLRNYILKRSRKCKFRNAPPRPRAQGSSTNHDNEKFTKLKLLNESTFLASLMPKKEIGADRFIEAHPEFDGRGVVIAIFDSGVDPAAAGLQVTSDGKPKVLDVLDCTGSGDIDTSTVVKADTDGCIRGASGASLVVNSSWSNPSGEWHVGCKLVYDLFTDTLTSRLKKQRKKTWDEKNQEAIAEAVKQLYEFDKKHTKVNEENLKRTRENLESKVDYLRKQDECYIDKGPVIDVVVWHDGELWRVGVDTQSLENDPKRGKLADFIPLTNYKIEHKFGVFSKLDACSFVANVYDDGNILSIVTDSHPHGTHVAGIATAFHPNEPLLNGVAPGAQLISCKIGDSRLGSMVTGTGLTRALIAAIEHKCDLINMSYGKSTLLADYGHFVDLVDEVVNKHRVVFVGSAGNYGPALTTLRSPGGTTSSIIGVGAYVSPDMAAGAHALVEPPSEGLEYTWSSRGPTVDGDLGISVSAPGGAVAPVPRWTLQRRMFMNGTSMASPSASGGVALLISAMKAEGISVSPYSVRKALENTCIPIGCCPEDKLSTGEGLMQVDKAHEYIHKFRDFPSVNYKISISQAGKSRRTSRGIYLREASYCNQSSEWTVLVEPKFHEDASNLEELVLFEECIELRSSGKDVVRAPEYLLLTHNGRSFNLVVDPTSLSHGLHYFEVYGIDCKAPWRGSLFRIPVTITKPKDVEDRLPLVSFSELSFFPGHIERRYMKVPLGATWVEATMRTRAHDTPRKFLVDTVQISPLQLPIKWRSDATFIGPSAKNFVFQVEGGSTMELVVSQYWSSGIGSHEATIVDFEIAFHGIFVNEVVFDGSEAPARIEAQTLLSCEKLVPAATLNKIRVPYRPIDAELKTLSPDRDKLPSGEHTLALTLTYKFKLEAGAEITPQIPLLNNRLYDNKLESQFYMISDSNKRVHATGGAYPTSKRLPKGEYLIHLHLRHDNVDYLDKLKHLLLFIERKLEKKDFVSLSFFARPDGPVMGNGTFKSSVLVSGMKEAFYVGPPTKDKIPKNSPEGSILLGAISYGQLSFGLQGGKSPLMNPASYQISYRVPPTKLDKVKGKHTSSTSSKSLSERIEEKVRDVKIKVLTSLKQSTDSERAEWEELSISLKSDYPKHTPLLAKILEGLLSRENLVDKIHHHEEIIKAANEVIDSIDTDELARYFTFASDPEDEEAETVKKKMQSNRSQLAVALYQKGLALQVLESLKGEKASAAVSDAQPDLFEENFKEIKKWVHLDSSKYGTLLVIHEQRSGRLGNALKAVDEMIRSEGGAPNKKLYKLKISLLDKIGWPHLVAYEKQWMHVRFPPSLPPF